MTKKKTRIEVNIPLEEMPLDSLVELIESGAIQEEIPFDAIAEHYPVLLDVWYPGFPGDPREMTEQDPIRCRGQVRNKLITLELLEVSFEVENWPDGTYDFFLREADNGHWIILFAIEQEEDDDEELLKSLNLIPY
jgi:hypothetical protein